jgi:hypothetical protein
LEYRHHYVDVREMGLGFDGQEISIMIVWRSSFILPAAILRELLRNFFRGEEIYEGVRGGSQLA